MDNQILDSELNLQNEQPAIEYGGFWIRVVASIIDFFVYLPLAGLNILNLIKMKSLPLQLIIIFAMLLYKPLMEFRYGATLGKMALKLKVVDSAMSNITLGQSFKRYFPWLIGQAISIITTVLLFTHPGFNTTTNWLEIGELQNRVFPQHVSTMASLFLIVSALVVAFNERKQGLHDKLADTYCIIKK